MVNPRTLIRGGRVIDPSTGRDEIADVLIRDGRITAVGHAGDAAGASIFDATGMVVAPGMIDVHVHLRVPGFESKGDDRDGDGRRRRGWLHHHLLHAEHPPAARQCRSPARSHGRNDCREARVRVHPIATISAGDSARSPSTMPRSPTPARSASPTMATPRRNSSMMRRALEAQPSGSISRSWSTARTRRLRHGAMNEGAVSRRLGISGIPPEAEEIIIARDLLLARLTGGWLHVLHVSTGRGAD